MSIPLELLAPAKNNTIGMAAIDHGADAVYIGAPQFSARSEAGNDLKDISRLIDYAHFFHASVYVALNTILTDPEIPMALDMINAIAEMGADGLIIQDPGLLELNLLPIPLIASTQMHNDTPEKVKFLEHVGFKRVILARELSIKEIQAIRRETQVELESFVHGALCVSYSGRCYMSQAVAKRSGNRGVCAQPCRSRYTLADGDGRRVIAGKFLLSLKDLNLSAHIADLVSAGVTSFKIEGRLKDVEYVKNVVAAYRIAMDTFIHAHPVYGRASSGTPVFDFTPDLSKTFNRGYTTYFINGRKEKIASFNTQKSMGQPVGIVTEIGRDFFRFDGMPLENGDGLCFFTAEDKLTGFQVNQVKHNCVYPNALKGLSPGTRLYRNHDHAFSRCLKKPSAKRQIALTMEFIQNPTEICLKISDEDSMESAYTYQYTYETAKHPERMAEQIHTHLARTGDTAYTISKIVIQPSPPGFIPLSTLNTIRRNALHNHTAVRHHAYPREFKKLIPNTVPYPETDLSFRANILNTHAKAFYKRHGVLSMESAFETLTVAAGKPVMTTRYCLRHELNACLKSPTGNQSLKGPLTIDDGRHRYGLEFDCMQCRMIVIFQGPCKR